MQAASPRVNSSPYRILVADDQAAVTHAFELLLKSSGLEPRVVSSPDDVVREISHGTFDLLLMDMNFARDTTSGQEGLELIASAAKMDPALRIVVMTAWSTIELAVVALQRGAADFIQKPWDNDAALQIIEVQAKCTREQRLRRSLQERSQQEALEVQRALLGSAVNTFGRFSVAAKTQSAQIIGGDYYDSFTTSRGFAFCVADCMGKGVAAALSMANLQAQLRYAATDSPAQVCKRLNESGCNSRSGRLTTMFYGVVDAERNILQFTNAGHSPALLVRANGTVERLVTEDALLGAIESWGYKEVEVPLHSGDRILLLTDGLLEASDEAGNELEERHFVEWLTAARGETAPKVAESIFSAALEHCHGALQDDATALVIAVE